MCEGAAKENANTLCGSIQSGAAGTPVATAAPSTIPTAEPPSSRQRHQRVCTEATWERFWSATRATESSVRPTSSFLPAPRKLRGNASGLRPGLPNRRSDLRRRSCQHPRKLRGNASGLRPGLPNRRSDLRRCSCQHPRKLRRNAPRLRPGLPDRRAAMHKRDMTDAIPGPSNRRDAGVRLTGVAGRARRCRRSQLGRDSASVVDAIDRRLSEPGARSAILGVVAGSRSSW